MRQTARMTISSSVLLMLCSAILGMTVLREQVAEAAVQSIQAVRVVNTPPEAVPVREQGTVMVAGKVTVAGKVAVTTEPSTGVVLHSSSSYSCYGEGQAIDGSTPACPDEVTPGQTAFYAFDTGALSAVRIAFQSLSGSGNCRVSVSVDGFPVKEWSLNELQNVSDVFEVPGPELHVRVETTNLCSSYLGV